MFLNNPDYLEVTLKLEEMHKAVDFALIVKDSVAEYTLDPYTFHNTNNWYATLAKKNRWFSNYDEVLLQTKFNEEEFLISEKIIALKWEYHPETKKVLGYTCKKATLVRNDYGDTTITAWYTEEIPVPFGPKGLAGLPGLVLETLQNEKLITRAIEIDWELNGFIAKPTTGKKVTADEWKARLKQYFEVDSPFINK